jgi:hypothetical protein
MKQIEYNMKTKAVAFLCGDLAVTLHIYFAGIVNNFGEFGLKVIGTLIIGAAGGIAGMIAKDYYPTIKRYIKSLIKKKK